MGASVSEQCQACITTLKTIVSILSDTDREKGRVHHKQVNDELERFSLWVGNIGARHLPESSMSLESRLREANDVLTHISELLDDLYEVAGELLKIVSGEREGEIAPALHNNGDQEDQHEETELLEESGACITRLFRVSSLIRQAAPTDLFAKALSRNRYHFNDQFDIAHVSEKYPKLATEELSWLRKRLGRAITQRRHYLSYIRDHREKLEGMPTHEGTSEPVAPKSQAPTKPLPAMRLPPDSSSRPSTFFTKASSLKPDYITTPMLSAEEESDPENDARSYTTVSRSIDGGLDSLTTVRIPKLDELRRGSKKETECPFCFRIKKFKHERIWRRHVFSDLRSYVCTFTDCDAPYFGDINEWFRHEMQNHRVSYTCQFCQSKSFQLRERYLAHVRKRHPEMLEKDEEQLVLDISRRPLDLIRASDCPCCSDWDDRLKERETLAIMSSGASNGVLTVSPTDFKRHLASHLEQLALFAIPIVSDAEGDFNSNVPIENEEDVLSGDTKLSALTFNTSRPASPASEEKSSDNVPITEESAKAAAGEETSGREAMALLLDRKGENVLITEEIVRVAAEHDESGTEIMTILLDRRTADIPITEGAVAWIAKSCNEQVMTCLLDRRGAKVIVTEEVTKAAAENERSGGEMMILLLDQRGKEIQITERVVKAAARNRSSGGELIAILLDRREEVEELFVQVIEMRKRVLGQEHMDTLTSMANLAFAYWRQGRWNEAEELLLQVIETRKRVLGQNHPDTLTSMVQLAATYQSQGRWNEAEELLVQVIETMKRFPGQDHPDTLTSMVQLAATYLRQGRWNEAEELHVQVLKTRKRNLRQDHSDTLTSIAQLAEMYKSQRRWNQGFI